MSSIKANRVQKNLSIIDSSRNDVVINENKKRFINFSFQYVLEDDDFHLNHSDSLYYSSVIRRLQEMCRVSFMDLVQNNSKSWRFHPIDWRDKRVSRDGFGLCGEEDLYDEAYQFSVSGNEHGRIAGFFTDGRTFNVVWFDKDHKLYP